MKQSNEVKAVQACVAYARHAADIKALGRAIHEGLEGCRSKEQDDNGAKVTHLSKALRMSVEIEETGERRRLHDDEILAAIGRCTHCRAAFKSIKDRKSARRSLGAAKRSIGMIGRRAA
jgi:hypothetical protein